MATAIELANNIDNITIATSLCCDPENCPRHIQNSIPQMTVLTQNIRSIYKNLNEIELLLHRLNMLPDIIVLTECRLDTHKPIPSLLNYNKTYTHNYLNQNDGIVVYSTSELYCTFEEPLFEEANCLIIKIGTETAIVTIYRSPSFKKIDNFLNSLNNIISYLKIFKNIIITGDINIDIKENNTDNRSPFYLNLTSELGFLPAHLFPTRENNCLDHILLKTRCAATAIVLNTTLTDHKAVLLALQTKQGQQPSSNSVYQRLDLEKAVNYLEQVDFSLTYQLNDANEAAENLVNILTDCISHNSQTLRVPSKKRTIRPWMTPGLLRCIRNRDKLHMKFKKSPDNITAKLTYQRYRNFCNNLLKKVKYAYERSELQKSSNDSKRTWKVIKNIIGSNDCRSYPKELLQIKPDTQDSLESVNNFFGTIGQNLAKEIIDKCTQPIPSPSLPTFSPHSLVLLHTTEMEIDTIITNLKTDSAKGYDDIPTKLIKLAKHALIPPLTTLCNLCIDTGVFPKVFKKSLIHPIFKEGDRHSVNNYRPISVLPILSKILEKILNKRLVEFLEEKTILSDNQFGFRKDRSTEDAVNNLVNYITSYTDQRKKCLTIFLDLKKAFDTVSIPILLDKMERLGIRGLNIFRDYLTNRTQRVKIGDQVSNDIPITFGIPQGSILGPSLFLMYINDLCQLNMTNGKIFCFADDTALSFYGDTWEDTYKHAEVGIQQVSNWLKYNLLSLNLNKTKYMAFSISKSSEPPIDFKLTVHSCNNNPPFCNCLQIQRTSSMKYLGVVLDDKLSWKGHIDMVTSRVRKLIWVFKRLRHVCCTHTLNLVYYALCHSVLTYCISIWGGAFKTHIIQLERAQRSVLKVMSFKPYRFPTTLLYQSCKLLTVRQSYILHIIKRYHLSLAYDAHLIKSKRRNDIVSVVPAARTQYFKHQYLFLAPFLYNKINKILAIYPMTKHNCKRSVHTYLLSLDYDKTETLLTTMT